MDLFILSLNITCIGNLVLLLLFSVFKNPKTIVNYLVAGLIGLPIFTMLFNLSLYFNYANIFSIFFYLNFPASYLWAPVLYLYILKITGKSILFKPASIIHIIPLLIGIAFSIYFSTQSSEYKTAFFSQISTSSPILLKIMNLILNMQVFFYCIICIKKVNTYEKFIASTFSNVDQLSVKWIKMFILLYFVLNILALIPEMLIPQLFWLLTLLPLSMMVSFMYFVYCNVTHNQLYGLIKVEQLNNQNETYTKTQYIKQIATNKSKTQKLPALKHELSELAIEMQKIIEVSQCYLDISLSLKKLSEITNTPVHKVSELINQNWKMNFFDFINSYRIDYAKNLISNPENNKFTIETIAQKSGFKTRSTFYNAFTKHEGITPTDFKALMQK